MATNSIMLNCWIRDPTQPKPFSLKLDRSDNISILKGAIMEKKKKTQLVSVDDDDDLTIWAVNVPFVDNKLDPETVTAAVKAVPEPMELLGDVFNMPDPKHLHVVVGLPQVTAERKRKREDSEDSGRIIEQWRSKRTKVELPAISELSRIVDDPLSESEKIPIDAKFMEGLISPSIELQDICTADDVKLLFRVGQKPTSLFQYFFAVVNAPPISGTEASFHSFWDRNVRDILELLLPGGKSTRDSSRHSATINLRPDYGFHLNNLCLFRGEEQAPDSIDDPKRKLVEKLAWAYSPAPYVLGYYATGPNLTLVAISPPLKPGGVPVVDDIASANLRLRGDRIKNIRRLINLTGLFRALSDLVKPSDAEFEPWKTDNGTVEIVGHKVIKSYKGPDNIERVVHLHEMYSLLREKQVPHVDLLVHTYWTPTPTVVLSPRGIAGQPKTEEELLEALICVLEGLEVLHSDPPIFHRDIRWPNVMRRLDDPHKWFIIDWEDASSPPTKAQPHFHRSTHSPRIFVDEHGPEVDVWGVGALILESGVSNVSLELRNLGEWMQGSDEPEATKVLAKIREYQSSRL